MRKNIIIAVLATVVAGFVILMILGLTVFNEDTVYESQVSPSLVQSDIPSEQNTDTAKKMYMKGCDDGTMTDYCACTYDYLTARYTIAQIAQMGDEYDKTGDLTEEMWAAVDACL